MIKIFGIKNCDTVKKALKWLAVEGVEHRYHDFRKDGLDEATLRAMLDDVGLDLLLNKRGTTWRKLPDDVKDNVTADSAVALMLSEPAMIKRPVWHKNGAYFVGFKAAEQEKLKA